MKQRSSLTFDDKDRECNLETLIDENNHINDNRILDEYCKQLNSCTKTLVFNL